jgi:hypothetical protein
MKRCLILVVLALAVLATSSWSQIPPPPSPADWFNCEGGCYVYAYWTGPGVATAWECSYAPCGGATCEAMKAASPLAVNGTTVTLTIDNAAVPENDKQIKVIIKGTGATGVPDTDHMTVVAGASQVRITGLAGSYNPDDGTWAVSFAALIIPQPDQVVITLTVPGTPAVTDAWVDECCLPHRPSAGVPSLTEWGMIILALLLLGSGVYVMRRRRRVAA